MPRNNQATGQLRVLPWGKAMAMAIPAQPHHLLHVGVYCSPGLPGDITTKSIENSLRKINTCITCISYITCGLFYAVRQCMVISKTTSVISLLVLQNQDLLQLFYHAANFQRIGSEHWSFCFFWQKIWRVSGEIQRAALQQSHWPSFSDYFIVNQQSVKFAFRLNISGVSILQLRSILWVFSSEV